MPLARVAGASRVCARLRPLVLTLCVPDFTLGCDFVFLHSRGACNSGASDENYFCTCTHFSLDSDICSTYIHRMKRVSLFLSEPQIAALKKLSKRAGIKASELIRRFIDEGLKRA